MSDFTKEELQILLFWGIDRVEGVGKDEFIAQGHDVPFKKLQDMIDNYCAHEWINGAYCEKCNKSPTE